MWIGLGLVPLFFTLTILHWCIYITTTCHLEDLQAEPEPGTPDDKKEEQKTKRKDSFKNA